MLLSSFFLARYSWLDQHVRDLARQVDVSALQSFVHEAVLIQACEHDVLRRGLLDLLVGREHESLRMRLQGEPRRALLEARLAHLPQARTAAAFHVALAEVRVALSEASARANAWALFAEATLERDQVRNLEVLVLRCHHQCSVLVPADEPGVRMELLH